MSVSLEKRVIAKAWEDETFKAQLLADPKAAIQNTFGVSISEDIEIEVLNETTKKFFLVIPSTPTELLQLKKETQPREVPMWR